MIGVQLNYALSARHCEQSEAIHVATRGEMDFFAVAPRNDVLYGHPL
jgi:hypothetical protein